MSAEWVGVVVGVVGVMLTFVGMVLQQYNRTHPETTLIRETASAADRTPIIVTVKPTDGQKLEKDGDVIRGVWYRISTEIRASVPRFGGAWRPVTGDLKLGRGDVVWFRCVTANVSDRVLTRFHVSFYEFPVLKRMRPTLRIVRRESPVATSSANGETVHWVRGFQVVFQNGWHFGGMARVDHLNPYDQAVLDVVFRVSPALIDSWTFRRLPENIVREIINVRPRPLPVVRNDAGLTFLTAPDS